MAIVLKEQSLLHKTRTLATDLSTAALQAAQKASYNKLLAKRYINSYQSYFPGGKAERYFKMTDEEFLINDELKRHIQFRLHNLVQDGSPGKFHIVFCRNVMIYFDDTLKMRVLKLFYDSLEDDGLLIIGYYDMLPEKSKDLFSLYDATTRIYRKNKVNT